MPEPNPADPNASRELTGRVGKYEILRPLGKGAMGQVYVAYDTVLEREVALKVMVAAIADDPELKQRFEREAKSVAKMQHPNVVAVFDLGSHTDGSPFIAMELLKGRDLQKLLREQPVPLDRRVAIIVQVLAGLAVAHQSGIVHRDIKPANIFIQDDGSAKIMDFGVARLTTASMTGTGSIVGTADYMSPEQVKAAKVDGRSDLFSVGCMLYELVTGRRPFHADNLMAIFYKITHEEADPNLVPAGPEYDALLPIIQKALAKEIKDRYQTAYDFAVDLREWLRLHSGSGQHALEGLVDIEAPSRVPMPMTDAPGVTQKADGTVELGSRPRKTSPPTRMTGRTVVGADEPTVIADGPSAAPTRIAARRVEPERSRALVWAAVAGVVVMAAVGGGALVWRLSQPAPATPDALTPSPTAPPTTVAPVASAAPPVTAAPQPTFAPAEGRGAAQMRAAQAAFRARDYERAAASAQDALREDPANAAAKAMLEQAVAGQSAAARISAGETALARGDYATAEREASAALQLAPWEREAISLRSRVDAARAHAQREAEGRAQQGRQAQVNALLNEASTALVAKSYDSAIIAYDKALALDPGNVAAQTGKAGAVSARALAEAAASAAASRGPAQPEHGFASGRTETKAAETSSGLVGFSDTPGVVVKKGTQAADMPGRVIFQASPASPKGGDRVRIVVSLANEGAQPIPVARLTVTTTIDGRKQQGSVTPSATSVAPGSTAVVWQMPEYTWRDGTSLFSLEVVLHTTKGDTYRNTLTWK